MSYVQPKPASSNVFDSTSSDAGGAKSGVEAPPESEHKGDGKKREIGGRAGPDPTRYGDWEKDGRCIDF